MQKKFFLGVYGCQMNVAEGERMAGTLHALGYERTSVMSEADLIIFHTCCVRENAEEKIFGKLGEVKYLKRKNKNILLGVTGCMAQKENEMFFKKAPHIDFILGTDKIFQDNFAKVIQSLESKTEAKKILEIDLPKNQEIFECSDLQVVRQGLISAWIPIMYGCNNFCTYCIVPYVRGRERSRTREAILNEAKESKRTEIFLLGQNVNSYEYNFPELLREVGHLDGVKRVRFTTSHPKDLSDELILAVAEEKNLCEHFHLPVQHGSDRILKLMNRHYTVKQYKKIVEKIRQHIPNVSLTTDLIVGFPGETEEDFLQTMQLVKEIRFDAAYTFMYSPREGTPAAKFENQIDDETKHRRLHELMTTQDAISREINESLFNQTVEVLVEGESKTDKNFWMGRTRQNKSILWKHHDEKIGDLVSVKITQPQTWILKGDLV